MTFIVWFDHMQPKNGESYEAEQAEFAARKHANKHDNYRSNPIHVVNLHTGEKTAWTVTKKVEVHRER